MPWKQLVIFQFHKGTIKTENFISSLNVQLEFQFHKGTIKTSHKSFLFQISSISIP